MYSVELKGEVADLCGGGAAMSFVTAYPPSLLCDRGGKLLRVDVPCEIGGKCSGVRSYTIPEEQILRITRVSDTKTPPEPFTPECLCVSCDVARDGILGTDKLELRAMGGYRIKQDGVLYPSAGGGTYYEPETFGFERGGTYVTIGGELAALWRVLRFNDGADALHLGFLTGLWPVDGSLFIPLSLHPRITFNDRPDAYGCRCDAWYLFGDLGVTFDFTTGAPISHDRRIFFGAGIGYEFPLSREVDFSVDVFARQLYLPLPEIDCCPDIPADERNPVRMSRVIGLRFGVTF